MIPVVTYELAYVADYVSLCDQHDTQEAADTYGLGSLGRVSHGRHEGECDACYQDALDRSSPGRAERRASAEQAANERSARAVEVYMCGIHPDRPLPADLTRREQRRVRRLRARRRNTSTRG